MTGEVSFAAVIGEETYITLVGVDTPDKKKSIQIPCGSPDTQDTKRIVYLAREAAKMIERGTNRTDIKVPKAKVTIIETYLGGTGPERPNGTIDIKPCEVSLIT